MFPSVWRQDRNQNHELPCWWRSHVTYFKSMTLCKWLTQHPLMWILGDRLHSLNSNLKYTAAEHSYVSQHLSGKKAKHWCYGEECEPLLISEGMQKSMKTKLRMVVGAGHGTSLHFRWEISFFLPLTLVCAVAGKVLPVNTNTRKTASNRL